MGFITGKWSTITLLLAQTLGGAILARPMLSHKPIVMALTT